MTSLRISVSRARRREGGCCADDDRGQCGGSGPHRAGAPVGDPEAASTHRKNSRSPAGAHPIQTSGFKLSGARLRTEKPSCGFGAPWIGPASVSRCERSCSSCIYLRVGFTPGVDARCGCLLDDRSSCPRTTASTDACRGPRDQRHGHRSRVPARPDPHARGPCAVSRSNLNLASCNELD